MRDSQWSLGHARRVGECESNLASEVGQLEMPQCEQGATPNLGVIVSVAFVWCAMHAESEFVRRMRFAYLILLTISRDNVIVHLCQWFEVFLKSAGYWTLWSTYLGAARSHTWGCLHIHRQHGTYSRRCPVPETVPQWSRATIRTWTSIAAALGVF